MRTLWGVANPEQLAALKKILEEYATEHGLAGDIVFSLRRKDGDAGWLWVLRHCALQALRADI